MGFPGGSDSKASTCNAKNLGLIPGSGRFLEKDVATHSNIFVWRIQWTEKPSGLQSMESQKESDTTEGLNHVYKHVHVL